GLRRPRHTDDPLRFGVVGLELTVAERPVGGGIGSDLRLRLEVALAISERHPTIEHRRSTHAEVCADLPRPRLLLHLIRRVRGVVLRELAYALRRPVLGAAR